MSEPRGENSREKDRMEGWKEEEEEVVVMGAYWSVVKGS